ncbi:MAG TPA: DUF4082 domain-containing protein, partial [Mycobacterium sp.]
MALILALVIPNLVSSKASSTRRPYVTIYPAKTVPATPAGTDPRAVELGVRFEVSTPGSVVALRYYKSTKNDGTHIGSLWSGSGTVLARATFHNESPAGWQTVYLKKPVALVPHDFYVASYHTSTGYYAYQQSAFAQHRSLGNTTVTASEGVFAYGAGAFPTSTWQDAAYYVDVLFEPSSDHRGAPVGRPSSEPPSSVSHQRSTSASRSASAPRSSPPASRHSNASSTPSVPGSRSHAPRTSFPGPSNTGVPVGTKLAVHSGDMEIDQDGYVLENTEVDGCIIVDANNVTIRNVLVK